MGRGLEDPQGAEGPSEMQSERGYQRIMEYLTVSQNAFPGYGYMTVNQFNAGG